MSNYRIAGRLLRSAVLAGAVTAICAPALAQDSGSDDGLEIEEIIATGTRIRNENIDAASPVTTIGEEEINLKQTPNIERIFRDLPITIPGDGENVNNGTRGQATLDLRGLGPEELLDPFAHLAGSLVREGHGEDLIGGNPADPDQVGDARREYARLAAAGTREDEQRTLGRLDGLALSGVQTFENGIGEGIRIRFGQDELRWGHDREGIVRRIARPRASVATARPAPALSDFPPAPSR